MSHDLTLSGAIKIKPDVTLTQLFGLFRSTAMFPDATPPEFDEHIGELDLGDEASSVVLNAEGTLDVYIRCHGQGHGEIPDELQELLVGLDGYVDGNGYLELCDEQLSASNSEALVAIPIAATDQAQDEALLQYAADQLRGHLSGLLPGDDVEKIVLATKTSALQAARDRDAFAEKASPAQRGG